MEGVCEELLWPFRWAVSRWLLWVPVWCFFRPV